MGRTKVTNGIVISCDECKHLSTYLRAIIVSSDNEMIVKYEPISPGWTRIGDKYLCPNCSKIDENS